MFAKDDFAEVQERPQEPGTDGVGGASKASGKISQHQYTGKGLLIESR
jgi:hypothetical protein